MIDSSETCQRTCRTRAAIRADARGLGELPVWGTGLPAVSILVWDESPVERIPHPE